MVRGGRAFGLGLWQFAAMMKRPATAGEIRLSRRGFLRGLGAVAVGLTAVRAARADDMATRCLSFVHMHTGERLSTVYFNAGAYLDTALQQVNLLLRDFRAETVHAIDPGVLDRLWHLQATAGGSEAFEVISAYRSPATNEALRRISVGVAEHSLHMEGRAVDVRLPGIDTARLAAMAQQQQGGGVGFYRVSDFVHLDTGRVRIWGDQAPWPLTNPTA